MSVSSTCRAVKYVIAVFCGVFIPGVDFFITLVDENKVICYAQQSVD